MSQIEVNDLLQFLNFQDFARKKGALDHEKEYDGSLATLITQIAMDATLAALQKKLLDLRIEYDVWEENEFLQLQGKRRDMIMEHDATRPEISSLKFCIMPKEKANGLKGGFLAIAWNKFVEEIAAGRMEMAEVLILDQQNVRYDDDPMYYCKIADLEGHVFRGGIRKIDFKNLGMMAAEYTSIKKEDHPAYFRWIYPEDYRKDYPNRSEEEYQLYEYAFTANALADTVLTDRREHGYVLHFQKGGKDYYGLITLSEYEDLKRLKDYITFMTPDNCFKAENNAKLDFCW
ncbi:MAG: hypothetical protein J5825_03055 [Lachnospiraceae bacterium]|nr:hypothetical protein [Lachnospiraceae bacterium]